MWVPLLLLGCFGLPAEWTDQALYQAFDYRIDRPRVAAVQLSPPRPRYGIPTVIDALILAPPGLEQTSLSVSVCGLDAEGETYVWDPACFANPEIVTVLATGLPYTWNPPDLREVPCQREPRDTFLFERSCYLHVPMLVRVEYGEQLGMALVDLEMPFDPDNSGTDVLAIPLKFAHLELTHAGTPAAGAEVEFAVELKPLLETQIFLDGVRWYVDGGDLKGTGRTAIWRGSDGVYRSENTLVVPADWSGPLRVAVVLAQSDFVSSGDAVWQVETLEIP